MWSLVSSIEFAQAMWLWAAPVSLIALFTILWRMPGRVQTLARTMPVASQIVYRHPATSIVRGILSSNRQSRQKSRRIRRFVFSGLLVLLLHLALAQPYRLGAQLPIPPEYRDIIFLVDSSIDMRLRDYLVEGKRTDRMAMLKGAMRLFIERLQGNRIGIVAFSERPYTLVPLTTDYALINYQLRRLEPAVLTGRRSDPARAMLYVQQQIQKASLASKQPVLVLITAVNRPVRDIDPRAAAAFLASKGHTLHTIAIGAGSYTARESRPSGLIYHPTNFQLLEEIARAANGQSFWARDVASLNQALRVIQRGAIQSVRAEPEFIKHPLYQYPLAVALLWLAVAQMLSLGVRRR